MITDTQKHEIARLLEIEAEQLGSWPRVATKVGANHITVRYNMTDPAKWHLVSDQMWAKVAIKLGYKINESAWHLVPTTNTLVMMELLDRAQNDQLFTAISHEAGQGKTAGVQMYKLSHDAVFYVECEESWSHKKFVQKLAETLGLRVERYSISDLTDMIVSFLKQKATTTRPLLIVDEANKLKPSSLRLFIPLFNKLQDEVGMVLIGAHDLKKHIQAGVRRDSRGMDELESRLGRSYMPLVGIFETDVVAICKANGLTDERAQARVWQKMQPERVMVGGKYAMMSKHDLRVLKQAVKHERAQALRQREPEIAMQQLTTPALA
ncbi:AAA family ATPase [Spirosoma lituiforme]